MHAQDGSESEWISIRVDKDWLEKPPVVTSFSQFVRQEPDWHAAHADRSEYPIPWASNLCYVIQSEWSAFFEHFTAYSNDTEFWQECATLWIFNSVNSLLSRHLIGHRHQLGPWPKAWCAWSHREKGFTEFLNEYPNAQWREQFKQKTLFSVE